MNEKLIICPSCKVKNTESKWNKVTNEIMNELNDSNASITPIGDMAEGYLYRCPNPKCEDELITDKNGVLRIQDENGKAI